MDRVQAWSFSVVVELTLGSPLDFIVSRTVDLDDFRVEKIATNAPSYDFAVVSVMLIDDFDVLQGGITDVFVFRDRLRIRPSAFCKVVTIKGNYSGLIPKGCVSGDKFSLVFWFKSPEVAVEKPVEGAGP